VDAPMLVMPELGQFLREHSSQSLAQALLVAREDADMGSALEQQMLQAAVVQLAPACRMVPCGSSACCWRWAAQQLLAEYSVVWSTASSLRAVLDEELGQSAQQRLLDLRMEHEALLQKWRSTSAELSLLRKHHTALEGELSKALASCDETKATLAAAEAEQKTLLEEAAASKSNLQAQLAAANKQPGVKELEGLLEEERLRAKENQDGWDKANDDLIKVKMERTDLEWKVQQLRIALTKKAKKKGKGGNSNSGSLR